MNRGSTFALRRSTLEFCLGGQSSLEIAADAQETGSLQAGPGRNLAVFAGVAAGLQVQASLETTLGQMAPPKSGHPLRMPSESGGIPGRVHLWEVPFALMLSPGWLDLVLIGGATLLLVWDAQTKWIK